MEGWGWWWEGVSKGTLKGVGSGETHRRGNAGKVPVVIEFNRWSRVTEV